MSGTDSRFPLVRLASKQKELMADGVFLSNRRSLGIIRGRVEELVKRIGENQAEDRVSNLFKLWNKYRVEVHSDPAQSTYTMEEINEEFEKAYHDYKSWEQLFKAVRLDKELVESEVKIARDLNAIMTAEDGYQLMADVLGIILDVEDDPKKLKRYAYELTRLVGDGAIIEAD